MGWEEGLFTSLHSFHIPPQLTEVAQTLCSFHRAPFTPRMLSVAAQEEKQHAARTRSPCQHHTSQAPLISYPPTFIWLQALAFAGAATPQSPAVQCPTAGLAGTQRVQVKSSRLERWCTACSPPLVARPTVIPEMDKEPGSFHS